MLRLMFGVCLGLCVIGCSTPKKVSSSQPSSFAAQSQSDEVPQENISGGKPLLVSAKSQQAKPPKPSRPSIVSTNERGTKGSLKGRTIYASTGSAIKLRSKEVILTFDDGPHSTHTPKIMSALSQRGVKGVFFMLGRTAQNNPTLAKRIASSGHTVATHTYNHPKLTKLSRDAAMAEVRKGQAAVRKAVGRANTSRFFRFPYLADNQALRAAVRGDGHIIVDVDVDSKDYFKSTPAAVRARTMARLRKRGKGVILLHDIHGRTASMLPGLLNDLKAEGYSVVTLRSSGSSAPLIAQAN